MLVAHSTIRAWSPEERRNLLWSLATSLTVHAIGLAVAWLVMAWLLALNQGLFAKSQEAREAARRDANTVPTIFVEVTPAQATAEAPENTPFYSVANSQAANPEAGTADQPRLEGSQEVVPRTTELLQPQPELLQPSPPPEIVPRLAQKPAPADLSVPPDPASVAPTEPRPRPRTLIEARLRQGTLAGPMLRQEGGVRRVGSVSLDVKASPFGAYDAALIAAVQKRWYDLIDASAVAPRSGRVVIQFTLHEDGRVTDARIVEQEVGEILSLYCRKAITDPAPYAAFPEGMRRLLDRNYRDVRFTFHYF